MRIAILDDYQGVALGYADWARLDAETVTFAEHLGSEDAVVAALAGFDVVVAMRERTPFPERVLRRLPALRLLVSTGSRNAAIDVAAAARLGIVVSTTGYSADPTIEHTWALVLAAARGLVDEANSVRAGGWQRSVSTDLHGRTLGLLGLGRIGSAVARIGTAFGMRPVAWSQNLTRERAESLGAEYVSKDELFRRSDVLSVHLVLSERTRGLVGRAELALMRPDAILVNTSRGPIVDEAALLDALDAGALRRAALDVFDAEPLPADHPLRHAPRALVTPHIGYVTEAQYRTFYGDAVEDIAAFAAGVPVRVARDADA